MTIDFVIVHDYPSKYRIVRKHRLIELAMEVAEIPSYEIHETGEDSLISRQLQGQSFPEGAVLYVHGNVQEQYENVGYARQFSQERSDLRFILQTDPFSSERHFKEREDYEYVRELTSQTPHASMPVICQYDLRIFAPERDNDYWLATYLQELKEIRGL